MRIYPPCEWEMVPWEKSTSGKRLKAYLQPLMEKGTSHLVGNVDTQLYILEIGGALLPLSVNELEYENSYVCSLYALLLYAEEEMERHQKMYLQVLLKPLLNFLKQALRWGKVNKVVMVNNFLLSTNLYPSLSPRQIEEIVRGLQERFPDYAWIFRSLNRSIERELSTTLSKLGASLITSRSIYLFNPKGYSDLPSKKRWILKKDGKLLEQPHFEWVEHEQFSPADAPKIKKLYDLLYLEKYSRWNPAFTKEFFEAAIDQKTFTLFGARYLGELVGVIGYFEEKGVMATPIVGYDTQLPTSLGLYRLLTARVLQESLRTKNLFHMSSGVGHFKRQRGATQELESMGVFFRHLPKTRQIIWHLLEILFNFVAKPLLKKQKL